MDEMISLYLYFHNKVVDFIASIEELEITPDNITKIVINEHTGTIAMGGNITVDECAITQGGLSFKVTRDTDVSQSRPFSYGTTIVTQKGDTEVEEQTSNSIVMSMIANINDFVGALNAVGATPRDCISILRAMKAADAIHATFEII